MSEQKEQLVRFVKKARELECNEDEAAFDRSLRRLTTKAKPKSKTKPALRRRPRGK